MTRKCLGQDFLGSPTKGLWHLVPLSARSHPITGVPRDLATAQPQCLRQSPRWEPKNLPSLAKAFPLGQRGLHPSDPTPFRIPGAMETLEKHQDSNTHKSPARKRPFQPCSLSSPPPFPKTQGFLVSDAAASSGTIAFPEADLSWMLGSPNVPGDLLGVLGTSTVSRNPP